MWVLFFSKCFEDFDQIDDVNAILKFPEWTPHCSVVLFSGHTARLDPFWSVWGLGFFFRIWYQHHVSFIQYLLEASICFMLWSSWNVMELSGSVKAWKKLLVVSLIKFSSWVIFLLIILLTIYAIQILKLLAWIL